MKYDDSANLAVLIDTEGDNSPADVFLSQSPGAIGYVDGLDRLEELSSAEIEAVPARFRADDDRWVGLSGRVRVIVYDSERFAEDEVPDSVFDLTEPEYEGRVGLAPPNGSFQDFVSTMRALIGDDETLAWLTAMEENGARTYPNNIAIREAVARGEIDFGLVNHYYNEQAKAEDPSTTTENHFMPGDDPGSMILTTAVGILDTAGDQREDAQAFVDFLLSARSAGVLRRGDLRVPARGGRRAGDRPAAARLARSAGGEPLRPRRRPGTDPRDDPRERARGLVSDVQPSRPAGSAVPTARREPRSVRTLSAPGRPARVVATVVARGVPFALPLVAYLVWHDVGLGTDFFDVFRDENVGGPLRRTLVLATTVALGATAIGTALAWLLTRTDVPGRRVVADRRAAAARDPQLRRRVHAHRRVRAGRARRDVVRVRLPPAHRRVLGGRARPHVAHVSVRVPARRGAARLAATVARGECACARKQSPRRSSHRSCCRSAPGAMSAGGLLVFLYALSEFGAVQLLHYDTLTRAIFSTLAVRPRCRDVAQPGPRARSRSRSRWSNGSSRAGGSTPKRSRRRRRPCSTRWAVGGGRRSGSSCSSWALALFVPVLVLVHWTLRGFLGDADLAIGRSRATRDRRRRCSGSRPRW